MGTSVGGLKKDLLLRTANIRLKKDAVHKPNTKYYILTQ